MCGIDIAGFVTLTFKCVVVMPRKTLVYYIISVVEYIDNMFCECCSSAIAFGVVCRHWCAAAVCRQWCAGDYAHAAQFMH